MFRWEHVGLGRSASCVAPFSPLERLDRGEYEVGVGVEVDVRAEAGAGQGDGERAQTGRNENRPRNHSEFPLISLVWQAVLSDLPVGFWQRVPLPRKYDRSHRNVVFLVLEHERGSIHVLATHVTRRDPRDRAVQLKAVIELFLALEEPAILLGDLNSPPDSPMIQELMARADVDDPLGRLADSLPEQRVDWIFVRGLKCVDAGVRDEGVSDHPLYWVELEWPGAAETPAPASGDDFFDVE